MTSSFSGATPRPSSITFVDTPALLDPFGDVPWKGDVLGALRLCDVVYLVIRAFNDTSVERWKSNIWKPYARRYLHDDASDNFKRSSGWQHVESVRTLSKIVKTHDKGVLAKLRKNATDG